jgi:hypothetical protein
MDTDTIIAIDLGRHNSVACVFSRATRAHTFRTDLPQVWWSPS